MLPFVDTHVHLLSALDDGPRTMDESVEMCRFAVREGVGTALATAHQNYQWPVTPCQIRDATKLLIAELREADVPLALRPTAEVTVIAAFAQQWCRSELLSVADAGQYILIEFPNDTYIDLIGVIESLHCWVERAGQRPPESGNQAAGGRGPNPPQLIIAHAERTEELLQERGLVENLISRGCLVQVTSRRVADPRSSAEASALKDWIRRGVVHLVASDGHDLERRPPVMRAAYERIVKWAGEPTAERLCSINGLAVASGRALHVPAPQMRRRRWWFAR